jgi:hypothetical protein
MLAEIYHEKTTTKKPVISLISRDATGFVGEQCYARERQKPLPPTPVSTRGAEWTREYARRRGDNHWRRDNSRGNHSHRRREWPHKRSNKRTRKWPHKGATIPTTKRFAVHYRRLGAALCAGRKRDRSNKNKEAIHDRPHKKAGNKNGRLDK